MAPYFEQSLPLCYLLSAIGGCLEVGSVALLAIPDARAKEGVKLPWWMHKVTLASNIIMQCIGSISSNLFACWFGPVSVVAPLYFSSTLVMNMLVFGSLLGMESFTRQMKIGTYVITVSTILLIVVGPGIQENQDIGELLERPIAKLWFSILFICMTFSTLMMMHKIYPEKKQMAVLLVARSTSYSLNLTVSRAFLLNPTTFVLIAFFVIKMVSGSIYTYAIVIQSTTVSQSKIVPLNATLVMTVNAITGILIWQDWKVISSWTGYVCVFLLLVLGCDLLLTAVLFTCDHPEYGSKINVAQASKVIEAWRFTLKRGRGSRNLFASIAEAEGYSEACGTDREKNGAPVERKEAWRAILSSQSTEREMLT